MLSELDKAYLAGIVDGEAYLGVTRTQLKAAHYQPSLSYKAKMQIRMVDKPTIQLFADGFGGNVNSTQYKERRLLYYFHASDTALEKVLTEIGPYLRLKRPQMLAVLRLRELQTRPRKERLVHNGATRTVTNQYGTVITVRTTCLSEEYLAMCEAIYQECKSLNYGSLAPTK